MLKLRKMENSHFEFFFRKKLSLAASAQTKPNIRKRQLHGNGAKILYVFVQVGEQGWKNVVLRELGFECWGLF